MIYVLKTSKRDLENKIVEFIIENYNAIHRSNKVTSYFFLRIKLFLKTQPGN